MNKLNFINILYNDNYLLYDIQRIILFVIITKNE